MSYGQFFLLFLLCGAAGAVSCGTKSRPVTPTEPLSRNEVQRVSYRSDNWQFVVCSPEPLLKNYLDSLAASRPQGKQVTVVGCADYDPSIPAVLFGDHLPDQIRGGIEAVLKAEPIAYGDGDFVLLSNYIAATGDTNQPVSTVTLYLSDRPGAVLNYLKTASIPDWGGVFRGRWGYAITARDGSQRMGDYSGEGWSFSSEDILHLPAIPSPTITANSISYFVVDEAISRTELDSILAIENNFLLVDSLVRSVYLYPSVERIGLRRDKMAEIQREGNSIHVVYSTEAVKTLEAAIELPKFLKGMTFAHEGYRVYNGYGGSTVAPSLDSLSGLGVNALAIVPYTYMRAPDETGELPVPDGAGSENDAAVIYSIRQAHAHGWAVLLKPQIWVGGAWPGDVNFTTEEEWEDFFVRYTYWIEHYARMAQSEEVAALCIGTELVHATIDHPQQWQTMIAGIRKIYSGKLTYAANWGREFEQLTFWGDLDAVGLNSYYPLSQDPRATDAQLIEGARTWMQLADSISQLADRPLWLTEVGYRSAQNAWINPHAEVAGRPVDYVAQQRCYNALFTAARESDRLQGMFVWKWPSYLDYLDRRGGDTGYVPGGKPAGDALRKFYEGR